MALQDVMRVDNGKVIRSGGGTSDYTDLSNKPSINGVELSGSKTASQLGMANSNTFQGTIAEWNALTTAEKKAYDHASLTGAGGGEYNVDKTTGDLVPTAGMPSEYPATQVMMSDGETSVEEAVDEVANRVMLLGSISASDFKTFVGMVIDSFLAHAHTNQAIYLVSVTKTGTDFYTFIMQAYNDSLVFFTIFPANANYIYTGNRSSGTLKIYQYSGTLIQHSVLNHERTRRPHT